MADNIGARRASFPRVVSDCPSWNWTPGCSSPIPYPVTYNLSQSANISPDVRYNSDNAFIMQSHSSGVRGDEAGSKGGVISGTTSAEAEPIEHSYSVNVNHREAVRCFDKFYMNHKNTTGTLICMPPPQKGAITAKGKVLKKKSSDELSKDQKKSVENAIKNLKKRLSQKKDELQKWNKSTKNSVKTWFGSDDQKTKQTLVERISKMEKKLKGYSANNFKLAKNSKQGLYAYVNPQDDKKIYLGKAFFKAKSTGIDSQMGTIAHEMSHFNSVAGTQDHVYGAANAKQLATKSSTLALDNADNFEYFIESN